MLPKTLLTLVGRPVLVMSVPDEDNSRITSFALRKVEDTKRVTRNRTSDKSRQHNGQKETSTKRQTMIFKILL